MLRLQHRCRFHFTTKRLGTTRRTRSGGGSCSLTTRVRKPPQVDQFYLICQSAGLRATVTKIRTNDQMKFMILENSNVSSISQMICKSNKGKNNNSRRRCWKPFFWVLSEVLRIETNVAEQAQMARMVEHQKANRVRRSEFQLSEFHKNVQILNLAGEKAQVSQHYYQIDDALYFKQIFGSCSIFIIESLHLPKIC